MRDKAESSPNGPAGRSRLPAFRSPVLERARKDRSVFRLSGGEIRIPEVFGLCRGVERALEMLEAAVQSHRPGQKLVLLGQIIHNPWVNSYFEERGVRILSPGEREELEKHITADDCAVIPAFGVPLPIQRRLEAIGCEIVNTSCGDVRRLWKWAERAAEDGYGVLVFGRAMHDETVVTKSRLAAVGGKYVVAGDLDEVRLFAAMVSGELDAEGFGERFGPQATNAQTFEAFDRLAQVSQTTMLYNETMKVREILHQAFAERFGSKDLPERLVFQPTVCRATQARQRAAVQLCRSGCDLTIVVGGFGSSNTRHLYELARSFGPAYFIETSDAMHSPDQLETYDIKSERLELVSGWLPRRRPLRIGILAGASSPETVVGQVLEKLAGFLG